MPCAGDGARNGPLLRRELLRSLSKHRGSVAERISLSTSRPDRTQLKISWNMNGAEFITRVKQLLTTYVYLFNYHGYLMNE